MLLGKQKKYYIYFDLIYITLQVLLTQYIKYIKYVKVRNINKYFPPVV